MNHFCHEKQLRPVSLIWKLAAHSLGAFTSTCGFIDVSQWIDKVYNNTGQLLFSLVTLLGSTETDGDWAVVLQNKEDPKTFNWPSLCVTLTSSGRDHMYSCPEGFRHSRSNCHPLLCWTHVYTYISKAAVVICSLAVFVFDEAIISPRDWRKKKKSSPVKESFGSVWIWSKAPSDVCEPAALHLHLLLSQTHQTSSPCATSFVEKTKIFLKKKFIC